MFEEAPTIRTCAFSALQARVFCFNSEIYTKSSRYWEIIDVVYRIRLEIKTSAYSEGGHDISKIKVCIGT